MTDRLSPLSDAGQTVVIVGAGLAGLRTAEGLREAGFPGRIVLIGDEPHIPYDRPPLSKAVLSILGHEDKIALLPEQTLAALDIDLRLGRAVVGIDREARMIVLSDSERVGYDRLVIATGSGVRTLPSLPPGRARVRYLRGLDDALALRAALAEARGVAIIGAGVIGLEVAAAAVAPGRTVSVIEAGPRVMGRAAAPAVSDFIAAQHAKAGVDLRLGTTVTAVDETADGLRLSLSDGQMLDCDLVVVGIGVAPHDRLARDCGLVVEPGGIVVDGQGATSDPAIFAAGEVAVHFNGLFERHDRQETWAHADAHGGHVGRSLVQPDEAYAELGSYWSDQYDFTLNVIGAPIGEVDVVRGDPTAGAFLVFHLAGGTIVGVSAINAARDLRAAKRLIGKAAPADTSGLANPLTDLKTLA